MFRQASSVTCQVDLAGFQQRVDTCNNVERKADYVPLCVGSSDSEMEVVGYIEPGFAKRLGDWPLVFETAPGASLRLAGHLATPEQRTAAVDEVLRSLRQQGVVTGWRDELYPVVGSFHDPPHFLIERAAVVYFGIKAYGVHVNGYVRSPDGIKLWVARRSKSKPTWPGKLDHVVAGGQPHGLSCMENVIKECQEEASIPAELARMAQPAGAVSYEAQQAGGIKRDVLFVYDLELPSDFVPTPQDGEVEEFMLMPLAEVARIISTTTDFKDNCTLVIIDFMFRHGFLRPEQRGYLELLASLQAGDCS